MEHPPRHHRRRRRMLLWGVGIAGALLLALAADAVYAGITITRETRAAKDGLQRAADQLRAGEVDAARASFSDALAGSERARGAAGHPAALVAGVLPWIGDDVDAVRSLAEATTLAAQAGATLAQAATDASWNGSTIPGHSAGRIDPTVIREAFPALDEAAGLMRRAETLVAPLDPAGKVSPVADAIRSAKDLLFERATQVERAALVADLLPGLLGIDGPRTYAIVMMTLSDPRGSGGYPGSYGVLTIDDGRFELEELEPTGNLGQVPPVNAPPDVIRRYARFGGLTHFISSTYSPDWPTAAQMWMQMWEADGREPLDGVIGADSVWMSEALRAAGPVETPVWPEVITADNVTRIADAETMRTLDRAESNRWQSGIATALWEAVVTRPLRPEAIGAALSRSTAERHLQIYSASPEEEDLLDELGAGGRIDVPANPLMVSWSGFVGTRTGYFAEKAVDYRATVDEDGTAHVTLTITLTNEAPTEPEGILLGLEADDLPVGAYVAGASVYLPADATAIESSVDGAPAPVQLLEREFDREVVLTVLQANSMRTTTAEISYRVPAPESGFRLDIVPQPELRPTTVTVVLSLPDDRRIVDLAPDMALNGTSARYEGTPTTPLTLFVRTDP